MNEEEKQATEIAKTQEETEAPEEEKSTPSSPLGGRSVFAYLAVLFGVAFLLLLFAYLMQQRDSQEITANLSQLRESMGSIQSIDQLVEENRQLREEKEALEAETAQLQEEQGKLNEQLDQLHDQWYEAASHVSIQEKVLASWLSFWQLETDFLAEDYEACAEFFRTLPADNVPYPEEQGVQERVEEIYAELVEQGILDEGEGWMSPEEEE